MNMNMDEFLAFCREGNPISGEDKELHGLLTQCSYEAQRITMELNNFLSFQGRDHRDIQRTDRNRSGFFFHVFPAILYGLREKHQYREKCVLQHRVFFSGQGRHPHRRRFTDRHECHDCDTESRVAPGDEEHHIRVTGEVREERLDRIQCHHPAWCHNRGQFRHCCRSSRHKRRSGKCGSCRGAGESRERDS